MIANYYGLIKEIDDWVGKILDKLESLHLANNTLVIFTSDHGEMLGAHGMREKNIFLEESVRVPLLMRFPGRIKPGTVVEEPVSHRDVYATINDYLGMGNHSSDGSPLRPLIENRTSMDEAFAISEWNWPNAMWSNLMVRTQDWKLMMPFDPNSKYPNALFNLKNDPGEMENLIGSNPDRGQYGEQAENLRHHLLGWCETIKSPHIDGIKARALT
jgi:arylsulfatase A-like enzyme